MLRIWLVSMSALVLLVLLVSQAVTGLPIEDENREMDDAKSKESTILFDTLFNILHSKADMENVPLESSDYDSSSYESNKRSKPSKWVGTGEFDGPMMASALKSSSLRKKSNEWKRQIPICLWKVCPAAPWLVNKRGV